MHIVYLTDHIYRHGGIEKVLVGKANYFTDCLNNDVTIITTEQRNRKSCYPLSERVTLVDIAINYDRKRRFTSVKNLRNVPLHISRMYIVLRRLKPDIIVVVKNNFDFLLTPFIHGESKKIKEYHNSQVSRLSPINSFGGFFHASVVNLVEKRYDAIVVLNREEQSFFKVRNTIVIPNSLLIPNLQAELLEPKVLAAGRIAPVKGFDRLIEAWALVVKEHPTWRLDIFGEDYQGTQSKLEKKIQILRIEENVSFEGVTTNLLEKMASYSLYLMTSYNESFSMVIVEALSVGLPTIAFDVPTGPRNIISNGVNGVLVDDGDIASFAKNVSNLITSVPTRIRLGIEAKRSSKFYLDKNVMQSWLNLFESLRE